MRVTFWGAAQTVTGSMHHLEAAGKQFLLDCGLYQGRRHEAFERNSHFPFPVSSIDGVISMVIESDGVRLAFSGDVGRKHLPILRDPVSPDPVDYLIMESTYGDRFHRPVADVASTLADVVNRTAGRGGKIIVPCFAVGRTQQLVMILHQLMDAHRIPS